MAERTLTDQRMTVAGIDFVIHGVPAEVRGTKTYLDLPTTGRLWLRVAQELACRGVATAAAFRFLRKALGWHAEEAAALLHVAPATLAGWETGAVELDRSAWAVLADEVAERLGEHGGAARYLKAAQAPRHAACVELSA